MLRIAFNFGRPPHLAFDQDSLRKAVAQQDRGEISRQAVHLAQRRMHIGNDLALRRVTVADSCQGERSCHELQEAAAIERECIGKLRLLNTQPLQEAFVSANSSKLRQNTAPRA